MRPRVTEPLTRAVLVAALAAAAAAGLTGCAARVAASPDARVEVRVAGAASADPVEVRLVPAEGAWSTARTVAAGRTSTFVVPAGWLTVRVPGRCVVPAAATGRVVVEVGADDCTLRRAA